MENRTGNVTGSLTGKLTGTLAGNPSGKDLEMEAGRVLIAQAARQAAESRQKLEEERQEKKEGSKEQEREHRDTPQLSEQSKWFGIEGKLLQEASLSWVLEMEKELWEALLSWKPSPEQNFSAELAELSRLYLALLEKILTYTTGEAQMVQMGRLDDVLTDKLNLLTEARIQNLLQLLARNGQTDALKYIWRNLYKRVTGENPSPRRTEQFLEQCRVMGDGKSQTVSMAERRSPVSLAEEGRLYRPSGKGTIAMNTDFDTERRSGELQLSQRTTVLKETVSLNGGSSEFSLEELLRAEEFAKHLIDSSRLFQSFENVNGNEEAEGLFAAITFMKGQMYAVGERRSGEIGGYMESLVNQMVDYYLSSKGARQVYYYTADVYARTKDSRRAMEEGLAYAYRMFREKKEDPAYRRKEAYSERAGFFQMLSGRTLEEDFQRGIQLLEKSWKSFLSFLDGQKGEGLEQTSRAQRYSPWGMLLEREELEKERERKADRMLIRIALLLGAAGVMVLFWKLFFG